MDALAARFPGLPATVERLGLEGRRTVARISRIRLEAALDSERR